MTKTSNFSSASLNTQHTEQTAPGVAGRFVYVLFVFTTPIPQTCNQVWRRQSYQTAPEAEAFANRREDSRKLQEKIKLCYFCSICYLKPPPLACDVTEHHVGFLCSCGETRPSKHLSSSSCSETSLLCRIICFLNAKMDSDAVVSSEATARLLERHIFNEEAGLQRTRKLPRHGEQEPTGTGV